MDNNEIKMEDDKYFKSKQHRYIFALVELDGTPRAKNPWNYKRIVSR